MRLRSLHPDTDRLYPDTDRLHPDTDRLHPDTDRLHPDTDRLYPDTDRLDDHGREYPPPPKSRYMLYTSGGGMLSF